MITNKDGTKTITISAEAAALLFFMACHTSGSPTTSARKLADEVAAAIVVAYPLDLWTKRTFKDLNAAVQAIDLSSTPLRHIRDFGIDAGIVEKPKVVIPATPIKLRMPDGKFAKANYRVIKYPEHGSGRLTTRRVLFGEIQDDYAKVLEWNGKEWFPKTFTLSKIRG